MKDSLDSFCSTETLGPLESKLLEVIEQNYRLQSKLKDDQDLYTEKIDQFELKIRYLSESKNLLEQTLSKLDSKKSKIKSLRKDLEKKNSEISDLNTTVKIQKEKINSLRKNRQQSVDIIKDLEEELSQSKRLNNTPTNAKLSTIKLSSEKKIPATKEFKTQTFSFNINEISEFIYNKDSNEQEKLIETQSKLLNEERNKNKKLKNKVEFLKNENILQENELSVLQEKMTELEKKIKEKNVFWVERIEKYKMENNELAEKIKEYQERESEFYNTSDCEGGNLRDELSGLNTSQKSRYFEKNSQDDISLLDLKYTIDSSFQMKELKKQSIKQKNEIFELKQQNEKLKKDIEKRTQASAELNKILTENRKTIEAFKNRFSLQYASQEVLKLKLVKQKLVAEVEEYRKELLNLTEKIIQKKVIVRRPYLEDINEEIYETPTRANPPRPKYSEGKKRRNNSSWGYNLLNSYMN